VLQEHGHAVQGAVVFLVLAIGPSPSSRLSRFGGRPAVLAGLSLFLPRWP
jgi:hypothetical protein